MATIVIVDDYADMRMLAREVAQASGWSVVAEADDGETALQHVLTHAPDLVLMDYHLPGIDGVVATGLIKAARPKTSVIAWSSADDPVISRRFISAGADLHVSKADLRRLRDALGRLCAA